MFSMFFGSGNLVFPLIIGIESESYWILGFLGLFITGIIIPFLGLFVIKLHNGSYDLFFMEGGKIIGIFLPFIALSLLGPFGVVPRCINVAYGGIQYVYPNIQLKEFSLFFCMSCFAICIKDRWMVSIIGKYITPVLLLCLIILIITSIDGNINIQTNKTAKNSFLTGFFQGYQTMDLIASFFFSSVIFNQIKIQMGDGNEKKLLLNAIGASLIGISLLSLVYLGFVFMGATYKNVLQGVSPQLILPTISFYLLGKKSAFIVSMIVIFSCLTTAVALTNIFARYIASFFNLSEKYFPLVLLYTILISFAVSLFDFQGISNFLAPVLLVIYPGLIMLTISAILTKKFKKTKIVLFYSTILAFFLSNYFYEGIMK